MGINILIDRAKNLSFILAPIAAGVTGLLVHILPFVLYGAHPLGYDTGFYRRYLIQPFVGFPNSAVPGLGDDALVPRIIFDILRFFHLPVDWILYGSYLACFAILPVLAFFLLKKSLGVRGALIGALLLALSPVSYTAFWYMLWKNAWALCLMLGAFIALQNRALWWVIALEIGIAFSHKTTAILYLAILAILFIIHKEQRKEYALHALITGLAFLAVNITLPGEIIRSAPAAVFIGWADFLTMSASFLILAVTGMFLWKKSPPSKTIFAFACASIAFPVLQLPFYERVFVFTDVALVLLSAFGVEFLLRKINIREWKMPMILYICALCAITGLLFGNLENQVKTLKPLVSEAGISQIETIGSQVPDNAILLTTTDEAPWFEGFTQNHIAAPGMLQDRHNYEAWSAFWDSTSTPQRIEFLNSFPAPLYISTLGDFTDLVGAPISCLKTVAPSLLRNDCAK